VAIPGRTRQVPGRHAVLLLPWSMASKTGRVMLKIGRVCEHGSKWKRMKDLRGYQSQMHKRHTAKVCCVRRCTKDGWGKMKRGKAQDRRQARSPFQEDE
jgi:hypothetical protein